MKRLVLGFVVVAAACGGKSTSSTTAAPPGDPVAAQIALGQQLYGANCAGCHGDGGEGSDQAPPVVGQDAFPLAPRPDSKRTTAFHTAADVFAFASTAMPPDAPGSLTTDQYLAIFAFDLTANGVKLTAPLDAAAAQAIVLHP